MNLYEWQAWHLFSSYFADPVSDLHQAALALVNSGMARCSYVSDGNAIWLEESRIVKASVHVSEDLQNGLSRVEIDHKPQDPFVAESLIESGLLRLLEIKQFGFQEGLDAPYVRACLPETRLISERSDFDAIVTPVIKLFQGGVVQVEIPVVGSGQGVTSEEFIANVVRLGKVELDFVWTSPELVYLITRAVALKNSDEKSFRELRNLDKELQHFQSVIQDRTEEVNRDSYSFDVALLWDRETLSQAQSALPGKPPGSISLADFSRHVALATGLVVSDFVESVPLVLVGTKRPLRMGDRWTSRPHIHIAKHDNQQDLASQNSLENARAFSSIYIGIHLPNSEKKNYLPEDLRPHEDYSAYVGIGGSVWIWSASAFGPEGGLPGDAWRLYALENQIKAELLEYGIMFHHQLIAEFQSMDSLQAAVAMQERLVSLSILMSEASVYGETRELLEYGWQAMGITRLRAALSEASGIAETKLRGRENMRARRWELVLLIVFGTLAVPAVATEVIGPAWRLSGLPYPPNPDIASLYQILVAVFALALILVFGWLILEQRRR